MNSMKDKVFLDTNVLVYAKLEDSVVVPLDVALVWETWHIRDKYLFSYWDSMITAAALIGGCNILYSEDLQHDQLIENQVRIINPFCGSQP